MITTIKHTLAAGLLSAFLSTYTIAWAQSSTTDVYPMDTTGDVWRVEISRNSLPWIAKHSASRELKSTIENLENAFADDDNNLVLSAGFILTNPLQGSECQLYLVNDGKIYKNKPLAFIQYTENQSCFENGSSLRNAAVRYRTSIEVNRTNKSGRGIVALGPQLALMESILYSGDASRFMISDFSAMQVVSSGYRVKQGDSLSGIAKKLTGKSSDWRDLTVVSENALAGTNSPHRIFPEDKVFLPISIAKAFVSSSVPGQIYSTKKINPEWKTIGIIPDEDVLQSLEGMNYHLLSKWTSTDELQQTGIWIPYANVGWRKVTADSYDPIAISRAIYGTSAYEVAVATLCSPRQFEANGVCFLPDLTLPTTVKQWDWLADDFSDRMESDQE